MPGRPRRARAGSTAEPAGPHAGRGRLLVVRTDRCGSGRQDPRVGDIAPGLQQGRSRHSRARGCLVGEQVAVPHGGGGDPRPSFRNGHEGPYDLHQHALPDLRRPSRRRSPGTWLAARRASRGPGTRCRGLAEVDPDGTALQRPVPAAPGRQQLPMVPRPCHAGARRRRADGQLVRHLDRYRGHRECTGGLEPGQCRPGETCRGAHGRTA